MSQQLAQALMLIKKDLLLDSQALPESVYSQDELRDKLIPVINYLLDKDFSHLLNALYRIDVDENALKELLATEAPSKIAASIADLIISREMQKAYTRIKYSSYS